MDDWVDVNSGTGSETISTAQPMSVHGSDGWVDAPKEQPASIAPEAPSVISKVMREVTKYSPAEQVRSMVYLAGHMPSVSPDESLSSFNQKMGDVFKEQDAKIIKQGIGSVLSGNMTAAMVASVPIAGPLETAAFIGLAEVKDKFINLRRLVEQNVPGVSAEIKDIAELADMAVTGLVLGGTVHKGSSVIKGLLKPAGVVENVNIPPDIVSNVQNSGNLFPDEKADLLKTLGVEDKHVDASVNSGLPLNVPTENVLNLADKPYWELAKHEFLLKGDYKPDSVQSSIDINPVIKKIKSIQALEQ